MRFCVYQGITTLISSFYQNRGHAEVVATNLKKTMGGTSSSEDEDSSLKEDVSKKLKKGRNNRDKPSYNSISFNYDNIPSTTSYTSIPVVKAPYFDGTCYNQWKHCMKNYIYSISPEVW
jgi:hypothetical protein